jgi:glycosyltransferase involved in cell wall biosynthesis
MLSSSVVITTCERKEAVARAILSVARQTLPPKEIIVVDDCSSYDVEQFVASLDTGNVPVSTRTLPRRSGAPVARNLGATVATGEVLMFLDDDDQWAPGKIERQMAVFEAHAEVAWVYTGMAAVDRISEKTISLSRHHESGWVWPNILFRNFVGPTSAVAIRRHTFEQVGGFDPEFPALQDYDLWVRLAMAAPVRYDGGHDLLFTSRSLDETVRISTRIGNYRHAYRLLELKYRDQISALTSAERRRFFANSCLVQMGKLLQARQVGRASTMFVKAFRAEPRIVARIGSSLMSRYGGATLSEPAIPTLPAYQNRTITLSVVIPVYNQAHRVGAALRSALEQDLAPLEVIVVDDGSVDDLQEALKPFVTKITILRSPKNLGAAAARNAAIAVARGTHVAFLDSDDTWSPGKLRVQAEFMVMHNLDLCCTGFSMDGAPCDRPYDELVSLSDLVWGCYLSPGTTLTASRELLLRMGGYDAALGRLEDWDLLLRMVEAGHRIGFLRQALANVKASGGGSPDVVLAGLMHIRERHLGLLRSVSKKLARNFRAGMAFETAGVYARSGRWAAMGVALLHALVLAPLGNHSFRFVLVPKILWKVSRLRRGAHDA